MKQLDSVTVTYNSFLKELESEKVSMRKFGTSYRFETARLALEIAEQSSNYKLFLHKEEALQLVESVMPTYVDDDRVKDVAKMLYTVLGNLHRKSLLSETTNQLLKERAQKRKQLKTPLLKPVMPEHNYMRM